MLRTRRKSNRLALARLLAYPAGVVPLIDSANPDHIREAVGAARSALWREDWHLTWVAA